MVIRNHMDLTQSCSKYKAQYLNTPVGFPPSYPVLESFMLRPLWEFFFKAGPFDLPSEFLIDPIWFRTFLYLASFAAKNPIQQRCLVFPPRLWEKLLIADVDLSTPIGNSQFPFESFFKESSQMFHLVHFPTEVMECLSNLWAKVKKSSKC